MNQRTDKYDCPFCREKGKKATFEKGEPNEYIVHLLAHAAKRDPYAEGQVK